MTTRVFLVDDSLIVRARLKKILALMKQIQIVGESEDADDAIERIQELKPDIIVLDLQLLRGTGFEVLEAVKKGKSGPAVIILTNFPYPEYQKKCLQDGADFFFDKSTAFREIPAVIAKLAEPSASPGPSPANNEIQLAGE